jgi:LPS-assembly lipoprotein
MPPSAASGVTWVERGEADYILRLGPERFSQRNLSVNAQARAAEFDLQMSAPSWSRCRRVRSSCRAHGAVNKQMENDPQNVVGKAEEVRVLRGELRGELATQIFGASASLPPARAERRLMRVYPEKLAADLAASCAPCT